MENDVLLPIKVMTWATIAAAAISFFATPAISAELTAAHPGPPAFVACLQSDGVRCRLVAPSVGISIGVADGDAILTFYIPAADGMAVDHRESVSQDIDAQVVAGTLSPDDAAYIFAELLSSRDLGYKLPATAEELKKAVGFPDSAPLSPQDQVDILASHLQMNLGVSAVTADYLVTKLGLQIVE